MMMAAQFSVFFCLVALCIAVLESECASPWNASVLTEADSLVSQMSESEKLNFLSGVLGAWSGVVNGLDRLNIPPLHLEDGPQGVAHTLIPIQQVTQFPSALTVSATFDAADFQLFARVQAEEQRIKGTNVLLGPMVNLARVPQAGRVFESVGEDPLLASVYAQNFVTAVQSLPGGMMAVIKHAFMNSQEYERMTVSEMVSERAARELYYPPFQAAIDAGVGAAMCSYNRINGSYACENEHTLQLLKEDLGFQGFVVSDWFATHSTVTAVNSGLDMEMPVGFFLSPLAVGASLFFGLIEPARVDDMVRRIVRAMIASNITSSPPTGNLLANATSAAHNAIALKLAEDSTVLLKNDGFLPLQPNDFLPFGGRQSIAVIGDETTVVAGEGSTTTSGAVTSTYETTPYGGIAKLLMSQSEAPSRPVSCQLHSFTDYYQPGNARLDANDVDECCRTCTAQADCNYFSFTEPNNCYLKRTNAGEQFSFFVTSGSCAPLPLRLIYNSGASVNDAVALAKASNVTVVVVATSSQEGVDREDLALGIQDELVSALADAVPSLIVVIRSPGAVLMPWASHPNIRAIVWQGLPGQEGGNALASVLFGETNPSGRLPLSFPRLANDTWLQSAAQYPGVLNSQNILETHYTEELLMGYRWYSTMNILPQFSFGAGLSYSNFQYSAIAVSGFVSGSSSATISFTITNVSPRDGADVAQLYITFPESAGEPRFVLRGFSKLLIAANEAVRQSFQVNAADVSVWDTAASGRRAITGMFSFIISNNGPFHMKLQGSFQSN